MIATEAEPVRDERIPFDPPGVWWRLLGWIGIAGGWVPVLVGPSLLVLVGAIDAFSPRAFGVLWGGIAMMSGAMFVYSPFTFAFGFLYVFILALPTLLAIRATLALAGLRPDPAWLSSASGAAVMLLATLPLQAWARHNDAVAPGLLLASHVTTVLALVCGQVAGGMAAARAVRIRSRQVRGPFRFTVGQVLAVTALISVLLALASVSRLMTASVAYAVTFAVLVYGVTCRPAFAAVNSYLKGRFRRRRNRRLRRST